MEEMRYSVIIDGRDAIGTESLRDAKYFADSALFNADTAYVYDSETDTIVYEVFTEEEED